MDLPTKIISAHKLHDKKPHRYKQNCIGPWGLSRNPYDPDQTPMVNGACRLCFISFSSLFLLDKWWMKSFIVSVRISMAAICLRVPSGEEAALLIRFWAWVSLPTMPNLWVKWQTGWQQRKMTLLNVLQNMSAFPQDISGITFLAGFDWFDCSRLRENGCFLSTQDL